MPTGDLYARIERAIIDDKVEAVQAWLQRNPQLDKNRLLGRAVYDGTARMCALLLQSGADPNIKATISNFQDGSVLYQAASHGELDKCRVLLDAGANPNERTDNDISILSGAGSADVVRLLAARGADAEHDVVAVYDAIVYGKGSAEVVKALAEVGCPVVERKWRGRGDYETPMHAAVKKGLADVVDVLLKAGADVKKVDQNNKRPYQLPEMTQDLAVVFARHGVLLHDLARLHPEWELHDEYVKRPLNQQRATAFYGGSRFLLLTLKSAKGYLNLFHQRVLGLGA